MFVDSENVYENDSLKSLEALIDLKKKKKKKL